MDGLNSMTSIAQEDPMGIRHYDDIRTVDFDLELAQLIGETDWEKTTKRLLAYTRFRLSRHGSGAGRFVNRAEDYVQEAVTLLIDGTRRFPRDTDKTLFGFLCSVVDSLISHDAEKARRRPLKFIGTSNRDDADPEECSEEHLPSSDDFETRIIADDEFSQFLASLDADLVQYVRFRAAEEDVTAKECAQSLGITVSEIRNMDRRLRRRRPQWNNL